MLEPRDRQLLLETLRPPVGYDLDRAIGTTFSLDLMAMLTTPLAFTLFDWEDETGNPDPLAMLESLRRYADRISVFCQAGRIAIPREHQLLFSYLEMSVIEVQAPRKGGVFHPKLWLLRYFPHEKDSPEPVRYRLLCLSRNLTFDRSWDTILVLDGMLTDRKNAFAKNHPLGDFIGALPEMAVRPVTDQLRDEIARISDEIRRVSFSAPDGMELVKFWPLGLPRWWRQWPFAGRIDRLLVISPFLSPECLERLGEHGVGHLLISRSESLTQLPSDSLSLFAQVFALSPEADPEESEEGSEEAEFVNDILPLRGLHAKLYVADAGWDARIWTGSANATQAAFEANVEFLIELSGRKSQFGIDRLLQASDDGRSIQLLNLLHRFEADDNLVPADNPQERLEKQLAELTRALTTASLEAHVSAIPGTETFSIAIVGSEVSLTPPATLAIECWPITLSEDGFAVPVNLESNPVAKIQSCSFEALTAFFGFELNLTELEHIQKTRFVLNLPLVNAPEGRQGRLLQTLLSNRRQVLRFLMLLLAENSSDAQEILDFLPGFSDSGITEGALPPGIPLFEALLRALDRDPAKLDRVARMLEDLGQSEDPSSLLPEGFATVWNPIWAARQRLQE